MAWSASESAAHRWLALFSPFCWVLPALVGGAAELADYFEDIPANASAIAPQNHPDLLKRFPGRRTQKQRIGNAPKTKNPQAGRETSVGAGIGLTGR